MRYIKVFLLVLVFFLVMMFFVQNQSSFADPVTLRLDLLFMPPMASMPMPLYSIMLICFALGALIVLIMLMWDRMTLTGRLAAARRRVAALEKQLQKSEAERARADEARVAAENKLQEGLKDAEARGNAALRGNRSLGTPEAAE